MFVFVCLDAKRRKIIPVLLDEDVDYPRVLRGISSIKARRLRFGSAFWNLLSASLHLDKVNLQDFSDLTGIYDMNNLDKSKSSSSISDSKVLARKDNSCTKSKESSKQSQAVTTKSEERPNSSLNNCNSIASVNLSNMSDSGIMSGANGIQDLSIDAKASPDISSSKKKNPGLKTLRRLMKSFNIMERKPKLGETKRSHSTSEALLKTEPFCDRESRSQSTNVPPFANKYVYENETCIENNISHTESELTLKDLECNEGSNDLSNSNDTKENISSNVRRKAGVSSPCNTHIDGLLCGQNILSPNIEASKNVVESYQCNDLNAATSRQVSRDDNTDIRYSSFDNFSIYSEVLSSDNNSMYSNSRKTSIDNCSNASSFHQMPFIGSSRQASFDYSSRQSSFECTSRQASFEQSSRQSSFENNSRPVSYDGTSLVSVEDNMAVDRPFNTPSDADDTRKNFIANQQKSTVMFEIML